MKRKLEHLAAKLAFEELEPAQAEALRRNGVEDAEWQGKLAEYAELRSDLRKLGERTPECTVSAERLRDAILGEGLDRSRRSSRGWSWVWAPVATGVLAFAAFSYLDHRNTPNPAVRGLGETPSYAVLSKPPSIPEVFTFNDPSPRVAEPTRNSSPATPRAVKLHRRSAPKNEAPKVDMMQLVAMKMMSSMDARPQPQAGPSPSLSAGSTVERADQRKAADNDLHPSDAGKLVLIGTDTNGQTGAPSAQEVESVANVSIGG